MVSLVSTRYGPANKHTRESSVVTGSHRCELSSIVALLQCVSAPAMPDAKIDAKIVGETVVSGVARRHRKEACSRFRGSFVRLAAYPRQRQPVGGWASSSSYPHGVVRGRINMNAGADIQCDKDDAYQCTLYPAAGLHQRCVVRFNSHNP